MTLKWILKKKSDTLYRTSLTAGCIVSSVTFTDGMIREAQKKRSTWFSSVWMRVDSVRLPPLGGVRMKKRPFPYSGQFCTPPQAFHLLVEEPRPKLAIVFGGCLFDSFLFQFVKEEHP